jgi:hypothetical protein
MMPRTERDETFDQDGNVIEVVERIVPERVVGDDEFQQIKRDLRALRQQEPLTEAQQRQWRNTVVRALSYLSGELDDEA